MPKIVYKLEMTLIEPMLGTVPKDKHVLGTYVASKNPKLASENAAVREEGKKEFAEEVEDTVTEEEKRWTGFHKDEKGLYILNYLVKGFIKYAANVLKGDEKAQKKLVEDYLFVFPRNIYLGVEKPDGDIERPIRVDTPKGARSSLIRSDYIDKERVITCELHVLSERLSESKLNKFLEYGQYKGLGQFRNGSYGSFNYILTAIK